LRVIQQPSIASFPLLEIVTLFWINSNFNTMTSDEISEYSQLECVHRFTRRDEYIDYEYSRLLNQLPEKRVS